MTTRAPDETILTGTETTERHRQPRCPECGTNRVKRLRKPDPIDRAAGGLTNWLHARLGGKLYHCVFCRLQFYHLR